jgi:hypothetical protein
MRHRAILITEAWTVLDFVSINMLWLVTLCHALRSAFTSQG